MHMIDTLICIVYIFVGAKWVLKKVEIEMISAPTNWKIIILKSTPYTLLIYLLLLDRFFLDEIVPHIYFSYSPFLVC